jgi:hypothetical protein
MRSAECGVKSGRKSGWTTDGLMTESSIWFPSSGLGTSENSGIAFPAYLIYLSDRSS